MYWARISMELGSLAAQRWSESSAANQRLAIDFYTDALKVYERRTHPREWADCHQGIGNAFRNLADGKDRTIRDQALHHYGMALTAITKASWPELWHTIQLELSMLHQHYAQVSGDPDDLALADEYYALALDMNTERHAELYGSLVESHDAFTRLLGLRMRQRETSDSGVMLLS
jgi:hypothetical protein